jgi:hypothetical protein
MALILEVLSGRAEMRHRVRIDALPFTIGRGYANDLILDDPYVDARHAQILRDENGDWYIEDAGSLNGVTQGDDTRAERMRLTSGSTVRIGRTTLRVRDTSDEVAPALRETSTRAPGFSIDALSRRVLIATIAGAAIVFTFLTWLAGYARADSGDHFTNALMYVMMAFVWGGCWAIASRVTRHRFHLLEHMTIFAVAGILIMVVGALTSLIQFYAPVSWVKGAAGTLVILLSLVLLLTAHLAYTTHMPLKRRATVAFSISALMIAAGVTIALATSDEYSDVPSFVSTLAPVSAKLVPAEDPDALERLAAELKPDVDALKSED